MSVPRKTTQAVSALVIALVIVLAFAAGPAAARLAHTEQADSFGTTGQKSKGNPGETVAAIAGLGYDESNSHLYALGKNPPKIYGFNSPTPTSHTPLGGSFPLNIPEPGFYPGVANDPATGNWYWNSMDTAGSGGLYSYDENGEKRPGFPRWESGEFDCGVATDSEGNPWMSDYNSSKVKQYAPNGEPTGRVVSTALQGPPCRIAFDKSTDDLYMVPYFSGQLYRYTAASNYTKVETVIGNGSFFQLAVDSTTHIIYAGGFFGVGVVAYRPNGEEIESFDTGIELGALAVDESTHDVYVGNSETGEIEVWPAVVVPDATTGEQTGFATVHGHLDPAGGGDVTECFFQYGQTSEGPPNFSNSIPCEPAVPPNLTGPADVSADLSGVVTPETKYDYRLVVGNAKGRSFGERKIFTPHFVTALRTEAATAVTREGATLNASFEGTGEDTEYQFEWGLEAPFYENQTGLEDAGTTTGPTSLSFTIPEGELNPQTTYHYRVTAINSKGESFANDAEFSTAAAVTGLSTDPATGVTKDSAELNASFTGEGLPTTYFFQYGTNASYGRTTPVQELASPTGPINVDPVIVEGLVPNKTYHFRVVAENSFGNTLGQDREFTTISAPSIVAISSSNVSSSEADLHAIINPEGEDTEYRFEYGPTTSYGTKVPIPDGVIPASLEQQEVSVHLDNLQGVVYHFRVLAKNGNGESVSGDQTFNFYPEPCPNETVRQQSGADSLPDCRAYELVTPEDAGNTLIYPANVPFSPTATSPSRVAYVAAYGLINGESKASNVLGDLYTATRTNTGWTSQYIGLPATRAYTTAGPPWRMANPYTKSIPDKWHMEVPTNSSMSEMVEYDTGYYPETYGGEYEGVGASNAPYVFDTTTGKQIDRWPTNLGAILEGESKITKTETSKDLSHFVFKASVPFLPGAEPGVLYDNDVSAETVQIVSLNEENEPIQADPVQLSDNGSHILMTVGGARTAYLPTNGPGVLYMRVNDEETFDVSHGRAVEFVSMTPDGSKVYFLSSEDLTEDGSDTDTSADLYMWTQADPDHLQLVSAGADGEGNSDNCGASWTNNCNVVQITTVTNTGGSLGENGGYSAAQAGTGGSPYSDSPMASGNGDIYFLSPEQLVGDNGETGAENLYDFRNGKVQFVAALEPNKPSCTAPQGQICSKIGVARINVSPDDSHMAFLSASRLTSYDNTGHSEMYSYTPLTGELRCASCLPSGKFPTSDVTTSHNGLFMTNDGRTFFGTRDALVPADTNGVEDVYEYVNGKPHLISSGTAAGNELPLSLIGFGTRPGLIGVSANGTDVYFATFDVLVNQDRNGDVIKVYDARTGGGFPSPPPIPGCAAADECHGPSSESPPAPSNGTGAALAESGNVRKVKKTAKKKPAKSKKKKHKKKSNKRHHAKRGANHG